MIAPNKGEFFDRDAVFIALTDNKLARFESNAFQSLLDRSFFLGMFILKGSMHQHHQNHVLIYKVPFQQILRSDRLCH